MNWQTSPQWPSKSRVFCASRRDPDRCLFWNNFEQIQCVGPFRFFNGIKQRGCPVVIQHFRGAWLCRLIALHLSLGFCKRCLKHVFISIVFTQGVLGRLHGLLDAHDLFVVCVHCWLFCSTGHSRFFWREKVDARNWHDDDFLRNLGSKKRWRISVSFACRWKESLPVLWIVDNGFY